MAAASEPAKAGRKSAEQRREEILEIALRHFAEGGYRGTSTDAIAREAGISQPYLFRLFHTKQELFLAVHDRAKDHLSEVWRRRAADGPPETALQRMGQAYVQELVPDRHHILLMLQSYVASAEPAIREHVRDRWAQTVREVAELSGAPSDQVWRFFATGMLLNVLAALDVDAAAMDRYTKGETP
jgi:AcrR family transcriptional regulator